jgi:hypothetical protein
MHLIRQQTAATTEKCMVRDSIKPNTGSRGSVSGAVRTNPIFFPQAFSKIFKNRQAVKETRFAR